MNKLKKHLDSPITRLLYILIGIIFSAGFVYATVTKNVDDNTKRAVENKEVILVMKSELKSDLKEMNTEMILNKNHRDESSDIHMPYSRAVEKFVPRQEVEIQLEAIEKNIQQLERLVGREFKSLKRFIEQNGN